MARIGIITYHRATNYGAVLQSYSLVNKMISDFPNDRIEIIDYSTASRSKSHTKEVIRAFIKNGFSTGNEIYKKIKIFDTFSNNLPLSDKKIVSNDIKDFYHYLSKNYDIVITGSDAVFNWGNMQFPTAYILGENTGARKMSYAASSHRLFYRDLPSEIIQYCGNGFSSFSYLGVRDVETEKFVKFCNKGLDVHHNCDPTLLINMGMIHSVCKSFDIEKTFAIKDSKPIIIVMSPDKNIGTAVMNRYSDQYNVVSLFVHNPAIKYHCSFLSPFEWANVFKYAKITITEYFHATIFSLLNGTPTVTIDKLSSGSGYEGKIHDLLIRRFGLPEMYLNIDEIDEDNVTIIADRIENNLSCNFDDRIKKAIEIEQTYYNDFRVALNEIKMQ